MNEGGNNPTPSRTLRIPVSEYDTNKYNYNYTLNGNVYFLSFDTIDNSVSAYTTLKNDNIPVCHLHSAPVLIAVSVMPDERAGLFLDVGAVDPIGVHPEELPRAVLPREIKLVCQPLPP